MSRRSPSGRRHAGAWLAALALSSWTPAVAVRTLTWVETPASLSLGDTDGVAVSRRGRLFLAPSVVRLGGSAFPAEPAQVWSGVADEAGNVYLGTGPEGHVLRIDASGDRRVLFSVEEPMVTALAITDQGELLAGTAPGGRVYRIAPDGSGRVWAETFELYVWALAVGVDGSVYAATGERGRVVLIPPSGNAEPFFDSDEAHIVSLVTLPDGGLLAGGAGRGLVYQIDGEGHALVLHDDTLPEVAALAVAADGAVLAAMVGEHRPEDPRPSVVLRLPDGARVGASDANLGTLEESSGPTLRGVIEGLGAPERDTIARPQGRLIRIDREGEASELWSSDREAPLSLTLDDAGRAIFGTGEPARLYRVEADEDVSLLSTLGEAQVTRLLHAGRSVVVATSNPAAAYTLESGPADSGVFLSRVVDAGAPARWGSIAWTLEGRSGTTEVYTRTGNSAHPDATWSAWSPALSEAASSPIVNPDGRFLQWRLRLVRDGGSEARVSRVAVQYEPHNRPPRLLGFRMGTPDRSISQTTELTWEAVDPDDDPLEITLEYRGIGTESWIEASTETASEEPEDRGVAAGATLASGRLLWDTRQLAEGEYEVRGAASDQAANPAGEGRRATLQAERRPIVDRTPPEMRIGQTDAGSLEIRLEDEHSAIRRLEIRERGRTRFSPRSLDGVCDSRVEIFRFDLPDTATGGWTARGVDAAGNAAEQPLPGHE